MAAPIATHRKATATQNLTGSYHRCQRKSYAEVSTAFVGG